ncbi:MAG: hypothetical protein HZA78_07535 [Candidatus Schekmanbacteria bacterium]|nr:hypothetical protein [Candidatus Schekmanbacteria bacterium]
MTNKIFILIILFFTAACATTDPQTEEPFVYIRSSSGYEYSSRQAEEPQSTTRSLDPTWIIKEEKPPASTKISKETEKSPAISIPSGLRRNRLQLRRNRYLLMLKNS